MTVKITLTPNTKEVEVKGYGTFTVRPLGAGESLQFRSYDREAGELLKKTNDLVPTEDITEEELGKRMVEIQEVQKQVDELGAKMVELVRSCFTATTKENEEGLERLFAERSLFEIRHIMGESENG